MVDFIYIGPAKTASTWIYKVLADSPQIYVPPAKDLQFFDRNYARGINWYLAFFKGQSGVLNGELSHDYILPSFDAAPRIARHFPEIRLITCVRNPFERALSSLGFLKRNGLVSSTATINSAAKRYPEIIEGGLYCRNFNYFLQHFDRSQLKILNYEDLENDPHEFARSLFDFLGLDHYDSENIQKRVNSRSAPRSRVLSYLTKKSALAVRRAGFPGLVGSIKTNEKVAKLLYVRAQAKPELNEDECHYLLGAFKDDLRQLELEYGINTSDWLADMDGAVKSFEDKAC